MIHMSREELSLARNADGMAVSMGIRTCTSIRWYNFRVGVVYFHFCFNKLSHISKFVMRVFHFTACV